MTMRVVLVGQGRLGAALLESMLDSRHELLVVLSPDRLVVPPGIRHWRTARANGPGLLRRLRSLQPDVLLVGSWSERLGEPLLSLPRLGCVNCHPSLLPRHRGSNPYLSAIVCGETVTGVTFHRMTGEWDAGPILLQEEVPIHPADTGGDLRDRCASVAAELLPRLLDGLRSGSLGPREQDHTRASSFSEPAERDREVDWRQPARRVHDRIRGMLPWYRCYTWLGERRVSFGGSQVVSLPTPTPAPGQILAADREVLLVATGDSDRAVRVDGVRFEGRVASPGRLNDPHRLVGKRFARKA